MGSNPTSVFFIQAAPHCLLGGFALLVSSTHMPPLCLSCGQVNTSQYKSRQISKYFSPSGDAFPSPRFLIFLKFVVACAVPEEVGRWCNLRGGGYARASSTQECGVCECVVCLRARPRRDSFKGSIIKECVCACVCGVLVALWREGFYL